MPRRLLVYLLILFIICLSADSSCEATETQNNERILSFHSEITVHPNALMTVKETITVNSTGDQIKRGIYRDFPTRYKDHFGHNYVVDFSVQEIMRDSVPESFHLENLSNGIRVYIGKKDHLLNPGRYTYRIVYTTNRQIGFFEDFDELYWNVTGNGWSFPIDRASATVMLPDGAAANLREVDAYTGFSGAREKNFTSSTNRTGEIHFVTSKRLLPEQGLTIVVSWPKGFVAQPTPADQATYWINDNKAVVVGLLGLCLLFFYYLLVWSRFGKDPPRGTIIPLFEPPQNLSPAALRFLTNMGYDDKVFTAAVINMAVKGYLSIEEQDGEFTLKKTEKFRDSGLCREERAAAARLFAGSVDSRKIGSESRVALHGSRVDLQRSLQHTLDKTYFSTNRKYFFAGMLISFAILIAITIYGPEGSMPVVFFMCTWLTGWTFGVVFMLRSVLSLWKGVLSGGTHRGVLFTRAVFMTMFSTPFVVAEIAVLTFVLMATSLGMITILAIMVFINLLFFRLLRARTPMGRKLMDDIEGFKMYLATGEKERLNLLNPPDQTPELFEKYLPYALALDVEQEWAEKFSDVFARAYAPESGHTPHWYEGANWHDRNFSDFASSLGSSLASVSASSSSPGSSSGGGGGGSSGGGGGGGGGGGW